MCAVQGTTADSPNVLSHPYYEERIVESVMYQLFRPYGHVAWLPQDGYEGIKFVLVKERHAEGRTAEQLLAAVYTKEVADGGNHTMQPGMVVAFKPGLGSPLSHYVYVLTEEFTWEEVPRGAFVVHGRPRP